MALISSFPCIAIVGKPTKHIKLSNKTIPCLLGKSKVNPIMNKALANVDGVSRRIGNHPPNLWEDDFIQSLPKHPYEGPYYRELAERYTREIKDMFNAMAAAQNRTPCADILSERLVMVDNVERLGIDRHFQKEITEALDYVYRYWKKSNKDLNTTALGLRILRLHRYDVSSDVLQQFKAKNGGFLCSITQSEEEIKTIINLFRASLIAFPREKVMDEAKAFATTYLNQAIQNTEISSYLSREITFNLEYGWYTNLPRVEARNYIDIYGENCSWAKVPRNKELLYFAKLDFNLMQSMFQRELQAISRWWTESEFRKLSFVRHRHVEYHAVACAISVDPKHSAFRNALAKFCHLSTNIDDIYDTHGTLEELKLFRTAVKRWDPSPPDFLPEYMKIVYMALYKAVNESARDAEKTQGRDTLPYARKAWEEYIDALMQEAEWLAAGYMPTLKEYLKNGTVSSANRITTVQALLTLDVLLPENIFHNVDHPSRFNELSGSILRLRGDVRTFKVEANRGEVTSCIASYMKDHPESTEKDALNYIKDLLNEQLKEFNWEYLKPDNVPTCCKDHAYNISRVYQFFYLKRDGFSNADKEIKNHVTQILLQPVPM